MSSTNLQQAIHHLFSSGDLSLQQAEAAMGDIVRGTATDAQIGAFLAALRMKGETVDEVVGCANAMKRAAVPIPLNRRTVPLVDTCGTGGDGTYKFNISTIAAFVVAGAGVQVAKHGNRSNTRAGSADVLEALGVNLHTTAAQAVACLEDVGITFLFGPLYYPAAKYISGPRRELATRTLFNFLGPLINPANPTHQVVGVYAAELTEMLAQILGKMGSQAAYVVHGSYETGAGLDELTTTGVNRVSHWRHGTVTTFEIDPADLGFRRATLADLQGGDATHNAAIARGILRGEITGAKRDVVLFNAAAALSTESGDLEAGLQVARESLESGTALQKLCTFVAKTQSFIAT